MQLQVLLLAEEAVPEDRQGRGQEYGPRVALAVWLEQLQFLEQGMADEGEGELGVQFQDGGGRVGPKLLFHCPGEEVLEVGQLKRFEFEASGLAVPAELVQALFAGQQGLVEVEGRGGAAGALEDAVFLGQDEAGAVESFHDARGYDADDARMPVLRMQDQSRQMELRFGLGDGLLQDSLLFELALGVETVQLFGQLAGFVAVLFQEQAHGQVRVADAAGRIDARGQRETDGPGADAFLRGHAADFLEGLNPRTASLLDEEQAVLDQYPVLVVQGNHIGHGAQGDKVQEVTDVGLRTRQDAVQGAHEQEADAHAGEIGRWPAFELGIDDDVGFGEFLSGQMMIRDDDLHVHVPGRTDFLGVGDAAVHGQQEPDTLLGQTPDAVQVEAVAEVQSVGYEMQDVDTPGGHEILDQGGRGDAVHVVVAPYGDFASRLNGLAQEFGSGFDSRPPVQGVQIAQARTEELVHVPFGRQPAQ